MPLMMTDVAQGSTAVRQMDFNALQKQYDPQDLANKSKKLDLEVQDSALKLQQLKDNILETGVEKQAIKSYFDNPDNVKKMQDDPIKAMGELVAQFAQRTGKLDAVEKLAGVVSKMEQVGAQRDLRKAQAEVLKHELNNNFLEAIPDDVSDLKALEQQAKERGVSPEVIQMFKNNLADGATVAQAKERTLAQSRTHRERAELQKLAVQKAELERKERADERRHEERLASNNRMMAAIVGRDERAINRVAIDEYRASTTRANEIKNEYASIAKEIKELGPKPPAPWWDEDIAGKKWEDNQALLLKRKQNLETQAEENDKLRKRALENMDSASKRLFNASASPTKLIDEPKQPARESKGEIKPATTQQQFDAQWAKLKSGESLVGPDGKTYTKK